MHVLSAEPDRGRFRAVAQSHAVRIGLELDLPSPVKLEQDRIEALPRNIRQTIA